MKTKSSRFVFFRGIFRRKVTSLFVLLVVQILCLFWPDVCNRGINVGVLVLAADDNNPVCDAGSSSTDGVCRASSSSSSSISSSNVGGEGASATTTDDSRRVERTSANQQRCVVSRTDICGASSRSSSSKKSMPPSIYRGGGTAQAYKPHAPIKKEVCDIDKYTTSATDGTTSSSAVLLSEAKYKTASWPWSRTSHKLSAPIISLEIALWSCHHPRHQFYQQQNDESTIDTETSSDDMTTTTCCCEPLLSSSLLSTDSSEAVIEIWQARPNGSYSSLRPGNEEGDCRAIQKVVLAAANKNKNNNASSVVYFTTVSPGSTGCMGGLGPSQIDFAPYGPPVIHILATAPGHAPTLIDLPMLSASASTMTSASSIQPKSFAWSDWRGQGWVKDKVNNNNNDDDGGGMLYDISSWEVDDDSSQHHQNGNKVNIKLNLYLQSLEMDDPTTSTAAGTTANKDPSSSSSLKSQFCRSYVYGFPSSFFLEPITVCAPSMLDYFAL